MARALSRSMRRPGRPSAEQLYDGHRDAPRGQEGRPGDSAGVSSERLPLHPSQVAVDSLEARGGQDSPKESQRVVLGPSASPLAREQRPRRRQEASRPSRVKCLIAACTGHRGCRTAPHRRDRRVSVFSPQAALRSRPGVPAPGAGRPP